MGYSITAVDIKINNTSDFIHMDVTKKSSILRSQNVLKDILRNKKIIKRIKILRQVELIPTKYIVLMHKKHIRISNDLSYIINNNLLLKLYIDSIYLCLMDKNLSSYDDNVIITLQVNDEECKMGVAQLITLLKLNGEFNHEAEQRLDSQWYQQKIDSKYYIKLETLLDQFRIFII